MNARSIHSRFDQDRIHAEWRSSYRCASAMASKALLAHAAIAGTVTRPAPGTDVHQQVRCAAASWWVERHG